MSITINPVIKTKSSLRLICLHEISHKFSQKKWSELNHLLKGRSREIKHLKQINQSKHKRVGCHFRSCINVVVSKKNSSKFLRVLNWLEPLQKEYLPKRGNFSCFFDFHDTFSDLKKNLLSKIWVNLISIKRLLR